MGGINTYLNISTRKRGKPIFERSSISFVQENRRKVREGIHVCKSGDRKLGPFLSSGFYVFLLSTRQNCRAETGRQNMKK